MEYVRSGGGENQRRWLVGDRLNKNSLSRGVLREGSRRFLAVSLNLGETSDELGRE